MQNNQGSEEIMAICKRGKKYWYHFTFNGKTVQKSTKQGNPRVARQMEAAHKTALAKGEVGLRERKPAPIQQDFAQQFIDAIQVRCEAKPRTVWNSMHNSLLDCSISLHWQQHTLTKLTKRSLRISCWTVDRKFLRQ